MRTLTRFLLGATLLGVACGGDSTGPSPSYESIAGSYAGPIAGISQGVAMDAIATLTITQNAGTLAGSWAFQGTLTDGIDLVAVQGTGTLTGTVQAGSNPSVNLTFRTPFCPNYSANFSGTYDSPNQRLTVLGPLEFFADGTCNVVLSFPLTLILTR